NSSAQAVSGVCRIHCSLRIRAGRTHHALPGGKVDSNYPPVDHGHLGLSDHWDFPGRALGIFSARLGRLLGMGSGRERFPDAVADGYRLTARGDDAGEAWHAEDLPHVAALTHLLRPDLLYLPDA